MVTWLLKEDKSGYTPECFDGLQESLKEAKLCAAANYGNVLFRSDTRELDYIRMREQQSMVLREVYLNIKRLEYLPEQAGQMREQQLPQTREEFEARAILFYILKQLQNMLELKRQYVLSH